MAQQTAVMEPDLLKSPELLFLVAFEEATRKVWRKLNNAGMPDEAIWATFRVATKSFESLAAEVDSEPSAAYPKAVI